MKSFPIAVVLCSIFSLAGCRERLLCVDCGDAATVDTMVPIESTDGGEDPFVDARPPTCVLEDPEAP